MVKLFDSPKTEVRTLAVPSVFANALTGGHLHVAYASSHLTCMSYNVFTASERADDPRRLSGTRLHHCLFMRSGNHVALFQFITHSSSATACSGSLGTSKCRV